MGGTPAAGLGLVGTGAAGHQEMTKDPAQTTESVRVANEADVPHLLELWRAAAAEPTATDSADNLYRLLAHDPAAIIVAEADGALVGSVIAGWDGWRGSIYRLAVAPAHRRTGVAGRLVAAAEERLSALGAVRVQAIVVESDDRAMGFWRASAWDEQVQRVRFVKG